MNGAQPEEEGAEHRNDAIERPCPACRNPISQEKLFCHTAFEPSDAEMRAAKVDEDDAVPIFDGEPRVGRVLRRRRSCSLSIHSEYDDEDDLDDFIVEDGHDDSDDDDDFSGRRERKAEKKRRHKAKGKARAIILSDDEDDDDGDDDDAANDDERGKGKLSGTTSEEEKVARSMTGEVRA